MEPESINREEEIAPVELLKKSNAPSMTSIVIFVILIGIASYLGHGWYAVEQEIQQLTSAKNTTVELSQTGEMLVEHWRINNLPAYIFTDMNHDNNYEKSSSFDFAGNKLTEFFDENEDGYSESGIMFNPNGKLIQESWDEDEDGCWERVVIYTDNNLKVESRDVNYDCKIDSVYVYSNQQRINSFTMTELENFYRSGKTKRDSVEGAGGLRN